MPDVYKKGAEGQLVVERQVEEVYSVSHLEAQLSYHKGEVEKLEKLLEEARKVGARKIAAGAEDAG